MSFGIYHIDTDSFLTASSIWTDSDLTIKASDGYYQFNGITRQLLNGLLLGSTTCAPCGVDCGSLNIVRTLGDAKGIFDMTFDYNGNTGASIITFEGNSAPSGLYVTYNGNTRTDVSSRVFGYLSGAYIGDVANDTGLVAGSPHNLDVFSFNRDTLAFDDSGVNESVTITAPDLSLTAGSASLCRMAINIPFNGAQTISVRIISPLDSYFWQLSVACPIGLLPSSRGGMQATANEACVAGFTPKNLRLFNLPVNGTLGNVGLYDVIYVDAGASTKLADLTSTGGAGFYKISPNRWMQIDSNSVVIALGECSIFD